MLEHFNANEKALVRKVVDVDADSLLEDDIDSSCRLLEAVGLDSTIVEGFEGVYEGVYDWVKNIHSP